MPIYVSTPICDDVKELDEDCRFKAFREDEKLVIEIDTRYQNHHQKLGIDVETPLYWEKGEIFDDVTEISEFLWPILYRIIARAGYYVNSDGDHVHFITSV